MAIQTARTINTTPTPTPTPTATATATPTNATPTPTATATATPTPTPTVQVTVQTNPAGLTLHVDGTTYSSTQTFSWVPGSSHTIATTSPQSGGTGVRYVWTNWSGGGAISHTVTPTTNKTYTANFSTQYFLTMAHGTGGTVSPASGWRNSGAAVSISATPANGYSFSQLDWQRHWLLLWHEQSGFNHDEWADYGERLLHSEQCSGDRADKSRRS